MALSSITSSQGVQQFPGAFSEMFTVTATVDPGSIADGDEEDQTGTVAGLALGDMVLGISFSLDSTDITITATVSAANTLNVQLVNNTGGAIDLGSGTVKVLIGRPSW